jgi:hypothetical protein
MTIYKFALQLYLLPRKSYLIVLSVIYCFT